MAYFLSSAARVQYSEIISYSARVHGVEAADRYSLLKTASMTALGDVPLREGSRTVPRVRGVRVYDLALARERVDPGLRVDSPRHALVYRVIRPDLVEILAIVHDRMHLARAARRAMRDAWPT